MNLDSKKIIQRSTFGCNILLCLCITTNLKTAKKHLVNEKEIYFNSRSWKIFSKKKCKKMPWDQASAVEDNVSPVSNGMYKRTCSMPKVIYHYSPLTHSSKAYRLFMQWLSAKCTRAYDIISVYYCDSNDNTVLVWFIIRIIWLSAPIKFIITSLFRREATS